MRRESLAEAVVLDTKLREYWSQHGNFVVVHHNESFFKKISYGLAILDEMVSDLRKRGLAEED